MGGADPLSRYRAMRDFARTNEPRGKGRRKAQNLYVIQKHAARNLHYDFRIELDGVLKSWAVPKGPSLDPGVKRLAVRTEDHPLDYAGFEGTIPQGQYGAGAVIVWDRGSWHPQGDPREGIRRGRLAIELDGERLRGGFSLVRLPERKGRAGGREQWLLIKSRDRYAEDQLDPTREWTTSVLTGNDVDAIAERPATAAKPRPRRAVPERAPTAPRFIAPQLPTLVDRPPDGDDWLHEIKHDGYRVVAGFAGRTVRLRTRNGHDWSDRFAGLVPRFRELDARDGVIDGEVVVDDSDGRTSFTLLQKAIRTGDAPLSFIAFDLLRLDGEDLRGRPLAERKEALVELLRGSRLRYNEHIVGDGATVHAEACRLGLEGIVSKRAGDRYRSGRSRSWLKTKCGRREEFVIGGMRRSTAAGRPFASLLIGSHDAEGRLVYRGRVGTGFDHAALSELDRRLRALAVPRSPFHDVPTAIARDATWVRPQLVAEIDYAQTTGGGIVRHARFVALREDKQPGQVRSAIDMNRTVTDASTRRSSGTDAGPAVAGVRLSNPHRVLYPAQGVTKLELARYLEAVAEPMLAHAANRPLSLVRCPRGRSARCFFQRHRGGGIAEQFRSVMVQERGGRRAEYLYLVDASGLVAGAQMGVLEFHLWGSRVDRPERPDRLVFDLDPGPDVDFAEVRRSAFTLRELLDAASLSSFVMLTGGKGLHVVLPLRRRHDWQQVTGFASALAREMAASEPDRFVAKAAKAARAGRIYLDWRRNEPGSTAIAPFSPRAREGAPVAVPVSWNELPRLAAGNAYTVRTLPKRLNALRRDPWEGYFDVQQQLSAAVMRAITG